MEHRQRPKGRDHFQWNDDLEATEYQGKIYLFAAEQQPPEQVDISVQGFEQVSHYVSGRPLSGTLYRA
ncbi:MAG: hypothetical protein ACXVBO_22905 [Isosphaeraceae bacterium]